MSGANEQPHWHVAWRNVGHRVRHVMQRKVDAGLSARVAVSVIDRMLPAWMALEALTRHGESLF